MHVDIKHLPDQRVAVVHHSGPYNQINEAFGRLGAIAGAAGLFNDPNAVMVALYHDDPETTPPEQLRSEAGLVVSRDRKLPAGLDEAHIAGGAYACLVHVGPYEELGDVWARFIGEWLPSSGRRAGSGASYELYLNNPSQVPKAELRTELRMPIDGAA